MERVGSDFSPPRKWMRRFELELGTLGKSATDRLLEGGVDRSLIYWNLWHSTRPDVWQTWRQQSEKGVRSFRRDIARFTKLLGELRSIASRVDEAVTFFGLPPNSPLTNLSELQKKGAKELDRLCRIYTGRRGLAPRPMRTQYDFVDLVVHSVRIQFRHHRREGKPWTRDLATLLTAAINAHEWPDHEKPSEFSGDSIRRHLERRHMNVKPKVVLCD